MRHPTRQSFMHMSLQYRRSSCTHKGSCQHCNSQHCKGLRQKQPWTVVRQGLEKVLTLFGSARKNLDKKHVLLSSLGKLLTVTIRHGNVTETVWRYRLDHKATLRRAVAEYTRLSCVAHTAQKERRLLRTRQHASVRKPQASLSKPEQA